MPIKRILLGAKLEDVLSLGAVDDAGSLEAFITISESREPAASLLGLSLSLSLACP